MYKDPEMQRAAQRRHYQKNKSQYLARARAWDEQRVAAMKKLIWDYLLSHPCVDCGEGDPVVLEFDHRDQSEKTFELGRASGAPMSMDRLLSELDKCDIRCANCHRRKTSNDQNWWRKEFAAS